MGNIQASEGGKSVAKGGQKSGRSKMRLLGGKKGPKLEEWTSVVPEENESEKECFSQTVIEGGEVCKTTSSSESNFTLALTPVGLNQEASIINEKLSRLPNQSLCYNLSPLSEKLPPYKNILTPVENGKDLFTEVFQPLNVFKLNEYRARIDQETASKVSKLGITTTSQISLEGDGTGFSTGVFEISDDGNESKPNIEKKKISTNKDEKNELANEAGPPTYRRHMSVPVDMGVISEGLNLQKAPSLSRAELEARLQRPKFVPEKLDFRLYEKFEGATEITMCNQCAGGKNRTVHAQLLKTSRQFDLNPLFYVWLTNFVKTQGYMLVNWYLSELNPDSPARMQLGVAELKLLASQFCTHLLAAGVLKQLPDPGVPPTNVFRPDCIYFWSHAEAPQSQPQTPGRLSTIFWPPTLPCDLWASPKDVTDNYVLGCQEVSLNYQEKKSSARDVEILALEEEIKSLRQEVDKYKTLIEIQNLTASAVKDFGSPSDENIRHIYNEITNDHVTEKLTSDIATSPTHNIVIPTRHIEVQTETGKKSVLEKYTQTEEANLEKVVAKRITTSSVLQDSFAPPTPPPIPNIFLVPFLSPLLSSVIAPATPPVLTSGPPVPPPLPNERISISSPPPSPRLASAPPPCPVLPPPPPPLPCPELLSVLPSCPGLPPPPCPGLPPPPPPPFPGLPPPLPPPCPGLPPPPPCLGFPFPPPITGNGECSKSPPLPGGPLPMPAPPPGGFNPQKAAMKKPAINPPVPMKPLYWTRILVAQATKPDDGPALWDEIEDLSIDVPENFTKLFSRQVVNRIPTIKKQEQKAKVEVVKLMDSKRSQSVGILAQSLRQDFVEIENAIYSFDTSVVSLEALQQIYEVRATPEELCLINQHLSARPDVPLDKPEQFLCDLSQITNFAERITCLTFQVEFEDAITTIGHTLDNFRSTCEVLTKSPELKRVLALILTLGNYMNGGNVVRGQADGFGLEVLSRLKDVKGAQAGVTLLHFVVNTYVRNFLEDDTPPPLPVPEPGDVRRAMALDFDATSGELNRLKNKLAECEKRTKEVIANSTQENLQPFKDKMEVFLEKSRTQHETECENLEECHSTFVVMIKSYLFKPKGGTLETFAPSGFFELWLPFCADFKDIYKKEIISIQVERAQELKRKEYHKANVIKERENGLKAKFRKARARLVDKQVQE